jgi:hypothetical protein
MSPALTLSPATLFVTAVVRKALVPAGSGVWLKDWSSVQSPAQWL